MDLRSCEIRPADLKLLESFIVQRKLDYQPFIFRDDFEVGEGYSFERKISHTPQRKSIFWETAPESLRSLLVGREELPAFRRSNKQLRLVYETFVEFILSNLDGGAEDRDFLEYGCNTGYMVHRFSQSGARRAIGMDLTPATEIFEVFNRILGTKSEFLFAEWDAYRHTSRHSQPPEVDVVVSSALLCHIPDPLHHLTYLCEHAREAVFLWTPTAERAPATAVGSWTTAPEADNLVISFGEPNRFANSLAWPLSFDNCVRPSRGLIRRCFEECGFEQLIEIAPPAAASGIWEQSFWKSQVGILALRTGRKETIFSGGRVRRPVPTPGDLPLDSSLPLHRKGPPQRMFEGVSHDIAHFSGRFFAVPKGYEIACLADQGAAERQGVIEADCLEVLFDRLMALSSAERSN